MAPESPGNLITLDLQWNGSRLECDVDRYDDGSGFLYVSWNAIACPENYVPVSNGVAYVWVPKDGFTNRRYRARVNKVGDGFEWPDVGQTGGAMIIVTLPPQLVYAEHPEHDLHQRAPDRRSNAQHVGAARPHSAALWRRRPPSHPRARPPARGKKTTLSPPAVMTAPVPITVVITSYETLRRVAFGHSAPNDGPSLGFTLVLRQGLAAWLRAWALCPRPTVPDPAAVPLFPMPVLVHHELAQAWAHMVLLHQEVTWI